MREKLVLKHSDFAKGLQKASQAHSSESSFIGSGGEILFIFNNKSYGISCINFFLFSIPFPLLHRWQFWYYSSTSKGSCGIRKLFKITGRRIHESKLNGDTCQYMIFGLFLLPMVCAESARAINLEPYLFMSRDPQDTRSWCFFLLISSLILL